MNKKRFSIIVLLTFLASIILATAVIAASCCIDPSSFGDCWNNLPGYDTEVECKQQFGANALFFPESCSSIPGCTIGCCCTRLASDVTTKRVCEGDYAVSDYFLNQGWGINSPGNAESLCEEACSAVSPQQVAATILANVTDTQGNPLQGASAEITIGAGAGGRCSTNVGGICVINTTSGTSTVTASLSGYNRDTKTSITINPGVNKIKFTLSPQSCNLPLNTGPPINLKAEDIFLKPQLKLSWENFCLATSFSVYRCSTADCTQETLIGQTDNKLFVDDNNGQGLQPDTTYYYKVRANYYASVPGWYADSTIVNQTTGDESCINAPGTYDYYEFCVGNARYTCTDNLPDMNLAEKLNDCLSRQKCAAFNGLSWCLDYDLCRACANPLGMFWNSNLNLGITDPFNPGSPLPACGAINYCYLDYSKTVADAAYACYDKTDYSCYDYKSKQACLQHKCTGACEYIEGPYAELGAGLCRPASIAEQDCRACNENQGLFSQCNEQSCGLYGDCYFGKVSGCVAPEELICNDYATKESCQSDSSKFCVWGAPRGEIEQRCYRDADGDGRDDCISNPGLCGDSEPPTTVVEYTPYTRIEDFEMTFYVYDNQDTNPRLYYCVDLTDDCIPMQRVPLVGITGELSDNDFTYTGDNVYYFRYYAEDKSSNKEQIKSVEVLIGESAAGPRPIKVIVGTTPIIKNGILQRPI